MTQYIFPELSQPAPLGPTEILLIASGDQRETANRVCWPAQAEVEASIGAAFAQEGITIRRAHPYNPQQGHGFISSQKMGIEIFRSIPKGAPIVVAEAVWQYSHHVLAGLREHHGPILTLANWSGEWPGLVGMLNLNGSLTKMGVDYSTIWSEDFTDEYFKSGIRQWIRAGRISHDVSHVTDLNRENIPTEERLLGQALAAQLREEKAIFGIFDEGCMGMYNAIIDDEMLNPLGVYKERLSQAALLAEMSLVTDQEAQGSYQWLLERGVQFQLGEDEATELTLQQVMQQMKMYHAAVRMADRFGCAAIGIQYQQGLKDMAPASDLVEGLLNNVERPPVLDPQTGEELYPGQAVVHFNEVDEGAGLDALITNRVWKAMGLDPATTLHDLRYGETYPLNGKDEFVWVLLISGAASASHFVDGYAGAVSERQPVMYFPLGGGTLKGVSKPGELVWSRIFVMDGSLHADLGRGAAVALPEEETRRRWSMTTAQWPIMHAVLTGVSRDQMMARHKANHINVVYTPTAEIADRALAAKAAILDAMGIQVHLCGVHI